MKPYWEAEGVTLYHGDCLEVLPTIGAGSVDAVITDPPYGIGYASARRRRPDDGPRELSASFGDDEYVDGWLALTHRTMARNSLLFTFTRWDTAHLFKKDAEACGFVCVQRLIWDKRHWGMGDLRYYGSQTEDVLLFRKGAPKMRWNKRYGNIWRYPSKAYFPEGRYDHPAQKPLGVITEWIQDATLEGATVGDWFLGSGTTGVACVKTGRRFIGIEIDEGYCEIARQRIEVAMLQPRML